MITDEVAEVYQFSSRIMMMKDGKIIWETPSDQTTEKEIQTKLEGEIGMNLLQNLKKSNNKHEYLIFLLLIVITIVISFFNASFLSFENLFDTLKSSSMFGIMAIGVTLIMISGGIDVSFPAIAAVAMHVTVTLMNQIGGSLLFAFIIASLIGVCLGAINALFRLILQAPDTHRYSGNLQHLFRDAPRDC